PRLRHVHRRVGLRVAAGHVREPGGRHGGNHLRGFLPGSRRPLLRHAEHVRRLRRGQPAPARPRQRDHPQRTVCLQPHQRIPDQPTTVVSGSPPAISVVITGLTNGTAYTFQVTAASSAGTGPASSPSSAVTPHLPPPPCPCTIFGSSTPATVDSGDNGSVVLG